MYIPWYSVYTYVHPKNYHTNFKKLEKSHYKKEVQERHKREEQEADKKEV
jgi:hypothetical protein